MRSVLFGFGILLFSSLAIAASPVVVTFDDLESQTILTNSNYAGLTWETGNAGFNGNIGDWGVPTSLNNFPVSGKNVSNHWGCTLLGIDFGAEVNVLGAYFAAQGSSGDYTSAVRAHGFLNGSETITTDWFTDIDSHPDFFAMNLNGVDRIVIEAVPVVDGVAGWYGMDNLTYAVTPEPATIAMFALGGILLRSRKWKV